MGPGSIPGGGTNSGLGVAGVRVRLKSERTRFDSGRPHMKNYWKIKGYCYWEKQINKDEYGNIWINIGWTIPICNNNGEYTITKMLALSAHYYSYNFN